MSEEVKLAHPPIPPNCPYFVQDDGDWAFTVTDKEVFGCSRPVDMPGIWRPIIAAIARCAWLDEAERLEAEKRGKKQRVRDSLEVLRVQAIGSAELWENWECIQQLKTQ